MTVVIAPNQPVAGLAGPTTFTIATTLPFYEVQLTTEPVLFSGTLDSRRRPGINFTSSGRLASPSANTAQYTPTSGNLPAANQLLRGPYIYYRALAYRTSTEMPAAETSLEGADPARAPFVYIDTRPAPRQGRPLSGNLAPLGVAGSTLIDTVKREPIVLRGVNLAGFDRADAGALDWDGNPQDSALEASGLSAGLLRTLVTDWGVNVVRLPISRRWALERVGYLKDIDELVRRAAAAGAYTVLAVDLIDAHAEFGHDDLGRANPYPALPDVITDRFWSLLARRYARESAVLYEVFGKPHEPLPDDRSYPFPRPPREATWISMWQGWARVLIGTIQLWNPAAVVLVSGWRWGLDLRSFPLVSHALAGVLYSAHATALATPGGSSDFEFWFGPGHLRPLAPVFVAEWGAQSDQQIDWTGQLERYLRARHSHDSTDPGRGVGGWTAWSIPESPPLLEVTTKTKTVAGTTVTYRTPKDAAGHLIPTPSGAMVQAALRRGVGADPGTVAGRAGETVTPIRPRVVITAGVGYRQPNRAADVRAVQARLAELRYLVDAAAEVPASDKVGVVDEASLPGTIGAILALQADHGVTADGAMGPAGPTLEMLNRAIPVPEDPDYQAARLARAGVVVTVSDPAGAPISRPVGAVLDADVLAGVANLQIDVATIQQRLIDLGHLAANHGEDPTPDSSSRLATRLPKTCAAIRHFQQGERILWWQQWMAKHPQVPAVTAMADRVVRPGDTTHWVLDRLRHYVLPMPQGPSVTVRNFERGDTAAWQGIGYTGWADPSLISMADYLAMGLSQTQARALQVVSLAEGKFDALNTYDGAIVSWGFIQFAGGGRGLEPCLALARWRAPLAFADVFQRYGIDVEYSAVDGQLVGDKFTRPTMVLFPPGAAAEPDAVYRGNVAESSIRDTKELWSVFIRAGRNREMQLVQMEAATRDYVLRALAQPARWNASSAPLRDLLASEQGIAILIDRAVQEGAGDRESGTVRVIGAMRYVARRHSLTSIADVATYEREVLAQIRADLRADQAITAAVTAAVDALKRLIDRCAAPGATVSGVLSSPDVAVPGAQLATAISQTDLKSLPTDVRPRSWLADPSALRAALEQQRTQLDPANLPTTTVAALSTYLTQHRDAAIALIAYASQIGDVASRIDNLFASSLSGPP